MEIYRKFLNSGITKIHNSAWPGLFDQKRCISKRSLQEKLGVPIKPKRPLTPYIQFTQKNRSRIIAENPDIKAIEISKKASKLWQLVPISEKEKLAENYRKELAKYTEAIVQYESTITDEHRQKLKEWDRQNLVKKQMHKKRQKLEEFEKPKKPPTVFLLYMLSKINQRPEELLFSEWLSTVGKMWNSESDEIKNSFVQEYNRLIAQYKNELDKWESKMIKMGHLDLLRGRVLLAFKGKDTTSKN